MLNSYLARKSVFFHLLFVRNGRNYFRNNVQEPKLEKVKQHESINPKAKKILIVGMSESPHLHTWLKGMADSNIVEEVWLFPSDFPYKKHSTPGLKVNQFPYIFLGRFSNIIFRFLDLFTDRVWRSYFLYHEIKRIKPTHIHFHETQHGAYLYSSIAGHVNKFFSGKLILSTWGSDLILYGKVESHISKITEVLSWVDLLTSERAEDYSIANSFGYEGEFLSRTYITIGNQNEAMNLSPTSERSIVLVKGYQDIHGRALNALACIEKLFNEIDLSKITFEIFSPSDSVRIQAEFMKAKLGINVEVLDRMPKSELMKHFMRSRVYLGLAVSDGLSTSMVEAMMHGAFPIQSKNSSAPEFLTHEITGGVVDPWDLSEIVRLLKIALTDDTLVDIAARMNLETLKLKFDWSEGLRKMVRIYE